MRSSLCRVTRIHDQYAIGASRMIELRPSIWISMSATRAPGAPSMFLTDTLGRVIETGVLR